MGRDALEEILTLRRAEVKKSKERASLDELERLARKSPAPIDFEEAITKDGQISLIAEMKRKSPSAGPLRELYDVAQIARAYEKGGARALSVLTETKKFGGRLEDLETARASSLLPVLRKDFIFDPYQIVESRLHRADAVLLIADMLDGSQLKELVVCAEEAALEPLVEVFTEASVSAALESRARLIGVNARNLRTLEMHRDNVLRLSRMIPKDRIVVAESGIRTAEDVKRLKGSGVSAVLVGESLLKQDNLEEAARTLATAGGQGGLK